jgi:hypothetical protein
MLYRRCRTVVRGIAEVEAALADLVRLPGPLPATNSGPGAASSKPAAPDRAETKNERFRRLAEKRAQRVLSCLASLGNLSAANYEYSEEEAGQVIAALPHGSSPWAKGPRGLDEAEQRLLRQKPEKPHFAFE